MAVANDSRLRVVIRIDGPDAWVAREDAHLVLPFLEDSKISFESGPDGILGNRKCCSLARAEGDGRIRFAAKLGLCVKAQAAAQNIDVQLGIPKNTGMPQPHAQRIQEMNGPVGRYFRHPHAMISTLLRFESHSHPFATVPEILKVFPQSRAVVAVTNRDQIRGWTAALESAGVSRPIEPGTAWRGGCYPLVHVTSFHFLDHCQPEHFNLAIIPDACPLRAVDGKPIDYAEPSRQYELLRHWNVPAFGFLPATIDLKPAEERRMCSLFGGSVKFS